MEKLKIGYSTINNSNNTLGLHIILNEIKNKIDCEIYEVEKLSAKHCDILLISLYAIQQVFDYPQWLVEAKINPKERKPIIVLGGSYTFNLNPLKNMFHYAVIGDGEDIAVELIKRIAANETVDDMDSIITNENIHKETYAHVHEHLYPQHYIELRNNKIARVEIARGCKLKCGFCQIANIKPYRELSMQVLKNLIATSPTKNIALFAPDRGSYVGYEKIEIWCQKYGKRNLGTDIRIDSIRNQTLASSIRFGVEGFSHRIRKLVNKAYSDDYIIDTLEHIFTNIKTPKGKNITTVTCYMILGLPTQNKQDYEEFMILLNNLNTRLAKIKNKITIFLTLNDFNPMPFTQLQNAKKEIYIDHYKEWQAVRKPLSKVVIAQHGGTHSYAKRWIDVLIARGGVNSNVALFNLTNSKVRSIIQTPGIESGKLMEQIIKEPGVNTENLIEGYEDGKEPYNNIRTFKTMEEYYKFKNN